MNPKGPLLVLLVILFLSTTSSTLQLGLNASANSNNTMLNTLLQQQATFETSINALVANLHNISSQVNGTSNTTAQILILEHAITTERQKIAQLQQHIIPPFNLSKTSCLQLTPSQNQTLTA